MIKQEILILVAHPAHETLLFYEGLKRLSEHFIVDLLCLTNSSQSIQGKELLKIAVAQNFNVLFKNMSDRGVNSLLYDVEEYLLFTLQKKKYSAVITHPPHGGEKTHPHHIQCFHIARRLCHQMDLTFGFFSDKSINCTEINENLCQFNVLNQFRIFYKYFQLHLKIRKYPLKNLGELRKEFIYLLKNIIPRQKYFLYSFHPRIFEKQSTLGIYSSQISSLITFKNYLTSVEYLYLQQTPLSNKFTIQSFSTRIITQNVSATREKFS